MKKRVLGIFALLLAVGVIYQLHTKSPNDAPAETAAALPYEGSQPTAATGSPSSPVSNEKVNAFVLEKVPSEDLNEELLSELRAKMTTAELDHLSQTVREQTQPQETRRKALYVLTQMGSAALPALTAIATTPMPAAVSQDPHSVDQMKQSFEAGLRVTAIEALDELGTDSNLSPAVKESMLSILKVQKNRSLTLLAQISLAGIESGRPGKVKRAVDNLLKEK